MRLKHAMMTTNGQSAADRYAARVDAVRNARACAVRRRREINALVARPTILS
jgi:hypothetical protein